MNRFDSIPRFVLRLKDLSLVVLFVSEVEKIETTAGKRNFLLVGKYFYGMDFREQNASVHTY